MSQNTPVRLHPRDTPVEGAPPIQTVGLHKHFGDNHVLKGIDLTIAKGLRLWLVTILLCQPGVL